MKVKQPTLNNCPNCGSTNLRVYTFEYVDAPNMEFRPDVCSIYCSHCESNRVVVGRQLADAVEKWNEL